MLPADELESWIGISPEPTATADVGATAQLQQNVCHDEDQSRENCSGSRRCRKPAFEIGQTFTGLFSVFRFGVIGD